MPPVMHPAAYRAGADASSALSSYGRVALPGRTLEALSSSSLLTATVLPEQLQPNEIAAMAGQADATALQQLQEQGGRLLQVSGEGVVTSAAGRLMEGVLGHRAEAYMGYFENDDMAAITEEDTGYGSSATRSSRSGRSDSRGDLDQLGEKGAMGGGSASAVGIDTCGGSSRSSVIRNEAGVTNGPAAAAELEDSLEEGGVAGKWELDGV